MHTSDLRVLLWLGAVSGGGGCGSGGAGRCTSPEEVGGAVMVGDCDRLRVALRSHGQGVRRIAVVVGVPPRLCQYDEGNSPMRDLSSSMLGHRKNKGDESGMVSLELPPLRFGVDGCSRFSFSSSASSSEAAYDGTEAAAAQKRNTVDALTTPTRNDRMRGLMPLLELSGLEEDLMDQLMFEFLPEKD